MSAADIVLFLGAGASREFGYPLTDELLPRIREAVRKKEAFREGHARKAEQLGRCLNALVPGFRKSGTLPSIVEVLSLLDHAIQQGHAFPRDGRDAPLSRWRLILEEAILTVISNVDNQVDRRRDAPLGELARWIRARCEKKPGSVGLVSTNYDIGYEFPLYGRKTPLAVAREWDFGMSWRDPYADRVFVRPEGPRYRLYKLHGSTNWLRCPRCDHVYVNPDGTITHQQYKRELSDNNTCHCGHGPLRSVIVAPSMVRDLRDPMLLQIWTSTFECLRRARRLVFIGYSLPHEDIAIRSLLLRSLHGRDRSLPPLEVEVVQRPMPDDPVKRARQAETRGRYEALFPRCRFNPIGTAAFIRSLTRAKSRTTAARSEAARSPSRS